MDNDALITLPGQEDTLPPMNKYKEELINKFVEQQELYNQILTQKALDNLYIFNKFVLGVEQGKASLTPFHKELCNFVTDDMKRKKLLLLPRGHLKSTLITIGYSTWRITKNKNVRGLILNATWQMAVDFLTEIKKHLRENETILNLYGDVTTDADEWSQDRISVKRTDQNIKGPTLWATGIDSNLVGSHPDFIIMDDVVNRDNTTTREQIEKVILRYKDALDLLEPGGQLIVIGTRWTDGDLYSWLMDKESNILKSYDVMVKRAYTGDIETGMDFQALWPDKFTLKELQDRLREKGWYEFCTPYETPILMSDFTTKPIGEIKNGDEIIGFDASQGRRKLKKTIVKKVSKIEKAPVYKLEMRSGRTVLCTKEHKWFTGRGETDKTHAIYTPAKVGSKLSFVCPVEEKQLSKIEIASWNYLAGIFDGEGSAKSGGCLTITQGHIRNKLVYEKIIKTLKDLKIIYSEYERKAINPKWGDSKMIWLKDNFNTQLDLIRNTKLAKKDQIADKMLDNGKRFVREKDEVLSIDYWKEVPVYALETETGNYIAWGYASSNSAQYLNDPVPSEEADFKKEWFQYYDLSEYRGKQMRSVGCIDPAISLDKDADFTAMGIVGIDSFTNIFIKDLVRKHMKPSEIIDWIFRMDSMWHPEMWLLETIAYQKALSYALTEEMRKRKRMLPIVEINQHDKSKDQRIRGLQPLYMAKKVFHPKGHVVVPYLEEELLKFPRARHDDLIDMLSMTLDYLSPPRQQQRRFAHKFLY